nr:Maf family protein [Candidatus Obscuribacter sp.]
ALQGIGAFMVSKINGCPANVKGLPTPLVVQQLRQFGILVMGL